MLAAKMGRKDFVKMLLDAGANVNMKSSDGWTAYKWAVYFKHPETAQLLEITRPQATEIQTILSCFTRAS